MYDQVEGLLAFSRVSGSVENSVEVNLNKVLKNALENLSIQIETSKAKIKSQALPKIIGNETLLIQVFQNLLSNALKFCKQTPKIEISYQILDVYCQIDFKDNGIGFNMQYKEKIFDMFKRLNNRDEFSGEGIGLALSKRIMVKTAHSG